MGKGKYDKLTYTGKRAADKRMAEQYGVDLDQYGNTERPGASYTGKKSWDQLSDDVAFAVFKDPQVQDSLQSARNSGNKKAQAIGNISNASEAYAAHRFMEKTHKNRIGNGGAYDGANDQGGVTRYWNDKVTDKRDAQLAKLTNDINGFRDEIETNRGVEEQSTADPQSFEHSDAVSKAKDNLEKYKLNLGGGGLFANSNDPAPRADDQNDATSAFADQYKMDVSKASDLGEVKARNLNNAASVVASYRR